MSTVEQQIKLELRTREEMKQRALMLLEKAKGHGSLGEQRIFKNLIAHFSAQLTNTLAQYVADTMEGKAKVKPIQINPIIELSPELVAYEAVMGLLMHTKESFFTLNEYAHGLGKKLLMVYDINNLESSKDKEDREVLKHISSILKRSSYQGTRKDKLIRDLLAKYSNKNRGSCQTNDFIVLARFCIDVIADIELTFKDGVTRKIIEIDTTNAGYRNRTKTLSYVKLAPWVMQEAINMIKEGYFINPIDKPMIHLPVDHISLRGGGYYSDFLKYNVVQTRARKKSVPSEFNYKAINTLQKVPYRINKKVLEVYENLLETNQEVAGLASTKEVETLPELIRLADIKYRSEEQEVLYKKLRKAQAMAYAEATSANSKVLAQYRILKDAQEFSRYPKIYFPYYFDYRGRLYAKSSNLNTQGADYNKSLLEYANGVAIGDEYGELYLCIHGANTYGEDKLCESDKWQWVQDNLELIKKVANDPIKNLNLWEDAEEPWGFLAFCFDYVGFLREGYSYKSHLNIALDGSCNGLQHLSAMKLDEVGGKEVNLIPAEIKADIYSSVANDLYDRLNYFLNDTDKTVLVQKILNFPTISCDKKRRKLAKKPTMTFAYASTLDNCMKNTRAIFNEENGQQYFGEDFNKAVTLVSTLLWSSVQSKILKGSEIMDYLQKVCRIILKNDAKSIEWSTPGGFKVVQQRVKETSRQLNVMLLSGQQNRVRTMVHTDKLSPKNTAAIAPNFIHALDADHLQRTVNSCQEQGINDFMMIHDSFGTHAGNTKVLAETLRQEFIDMYLQNDVLYDFIKEQDWFLMEELEKQDIKVPNNGKLNLRGIAKSEYFFS